MKFCVLRHQTECNFHHDNVLYPFPYHIPTKPNWAHHDNIKICALSPWIPVKLYFRHFLKILFDKAQCLEAGWTKKIQFTCKFIAQIIYFQEIQLLLKLYYKLKLELAPWSPVPPTKNYLKSGFLKKYFFFKLNIRFFCRTKQTYI